MALSITAEDATKCSSAMGEMRTIMESGATTGGPNVVASILSSGQFDLGSPAKMPDFCQAVALAVVRCLAIAPLQLATYSTAGVPSGSPGGRLIYVTDGANGAPIVAFSDGSTWLRVDTREALATI